MTGIDIDNNRLILNPEGINIEKYAAEPAKTVAQTSGFSYKEPVQFEHGFGDPSAYDRLQELLQNKEQTEHTAQAVETNASVPNSVECAPCC